MNEDKFLKVAKEAAEEAGKVLKKYFGKKHKYVLKPDPSDFSTVADLKAEKEIIKIIRGNFLNHNIIAEERGMINRGSGYTWVIDPLDGTVAFAAGLPLFAVSVALLKGNKPILGVVNQVMAEELYWAQKGTGAFLNGKKIRVSQTDKLENANVGIDFGHRTKRQRKYDTFILPIMNNVRYLYELGSDAAMLGLVAVGGLDEFATDAWVWDFAGGAIIVEEAGGKVTDLEGNEPDWSKERLSIVASNGLIHDQILEALKK